MKPKAILKILLDVLMTLALLFLMGYQLWGEAPHEWVGAGMFVLFILHHLLNGSWHKSLLRGKYTPMRVLMLCIDALVLIVMLLQMYSGIVMSRHVFSFLGIGGGMMLARRLHILGAYWGFALMSLHLGLHWSSLTGMAKKRFGRAKPPKGGAIALFLAGLAVAAYGLAVFLNRELPSYMLLRNEFVFLDYDEPKLLFYLDYLAMMGLFVLIGYYLARTFKRAAKAKGMGK
ncbi:DUF4405 domain-containing protein [Allofournierella sp.]|uniref:DUF4405 domain-containing protein n=1 Tax=Allofournierella sp. TaxID=1940256 RepID=UPI003AF1DA6E